MSVSSRTSLSAARNAESMPQLPAAAANDSKVVYGERELATTLDAGTRPGPGLFGQSRFS